MTDEAIHISLTDDEKSRIRAAAGQRDQSMSEFGRDILTDWLDDETASIEK